MNILLTNDDGVHSPGIEELARTLRSRGQHRVYVLAPDSDRSGVSNGIFVVSGPLKLVRLGEDTWSCSGLPADCVIAAMLGALPVKPDFVLSGINRGANLGTDVIYSGTAAAARQASLMGVPAAALSLTGEGEAGYHWDMAASWSSDHLEELAAFWREDCFVNVNIPNSSAGPEGIKSTWLALKRYNDTLRVIDTGGGSSWCFMNFGGAMSEKEAGSDFSAVCRNFVSVSVVHNYPVVRKDLCPGAPDYAAVPPRNGKKELERG